MVQLFTRWSLLNARASCQHIHWKLTYVNRLTCDWYLLLYVTYAMFYRCMQVFDGSYVKLESLVLTLSKSEFGPGFNRKFDSILFCSVVSVKTNVWLPCQLEYLNYPRFNPFKSGYVHCGFKIYLLLTLDSKRCSEIGGPIYCTLNFRRHYSVWIINSPKLNVEMNNATDTLNSMQ